jgi:hypothetical protein
MRFWVGLVVGIAATIAVVAALVFSGRLATPLIGSERYLDCAGRQTITRNYAQDPGHEETHTLLRMRSSGQTPTVELVQSLSGGPLGLGYVADMCGDIECRVESSNARILVQYGEPLGDVFHHLEISRVTGDYTASQRVGHGKRNMQNCGPTTVLKNC